MKAWLLSRFKRRLLSRRHNQTLLTIRHKRHLSGRGLYLYALYSSVNSKGIISDAFTL